jgi:hypothetical protein
MAFSMYFELHIIHRSSVKLLWAGKYAHVKNALQ